MKRSQEEAAHEQRRPAAAAMDRLCHRGSDDSASAVWELSLTKSSITRDALPRSETIVNVACYRMSTSPRTRETR